MLGSMGCNTYHQMLAVRFLLGFFEAPIVPALVSYTALFWTRKENAARTLIWGAMQVSLASRGTG
jgi:MFS family permease